MSTTFALFMVQTALNLRQVHVMFCNNNSSYNNGGKRSVDDCLWYVYLLSDRGIRRDLTVKTQHIYYSRSKQELTLDGDCVAWRDVVATLNNNRYLPVRTLVLNNIPHDRTVADIVIPLDSTKTIVNLYITGSSDLTPNVLVPLEHILNTFQLIAFDARFCEGHDLLLKYPRATNITWVDRNQYAYSRIFDEDKNQKRDGADAGGGGGMGSMCSLM